MPKSILKNASASIKATSSPAAHSREDRYKETALYHANIIQQRKDTEALILASTEILLDLPSSPEADPVNPSSNNAALTKKLLKPFQPFDYDSLIEERNIDKKCGYVLCPRLNRQECTKAKYRILQAKGKGANALKVVKRQSLEKWCSDQCGKRALYIKVQLSEEPAWTRNADANRDLVLLEETLDVERCPDDSAVLVGGLQKLDIGFGEERIIAALKELAIERGDRGPQSGASWLVEAGIKENDAAGQRLPLSPDQIARHDGTTGLYNSVEGYTPSLSRSLRQRGRGMDEEGDGQDLMRTI